jgi:aspartyl-tRNA(Asn)/glutamyl-tRNA(Gln) amidotransferase subunit C
MIEVNELLTQKIAKLSRLELSGDEVCLFTHQLKGILNYVEQLQKIPVEGVEPLVHPFTLETPMREDQVLASPVDSEGRPKTLESAPEVLYDGFQVPPIL